MGLRLTNAADYAIQAMIHIACIPEGEVALRNDVARANEIPQSFTAKILRSLVHAGLLSSMRGARGGFYLARRASTISLLDIVEAIEGPIQLTDCTGTGTCPWSDDCAAHPIWCRVQEEIVSILRANTLEMLVSARRKNRRVGTIAFPGR